MSGGTTIVDRLNKLSGKDATTIAKALENLEEGGGIGGFEIHICTSAEYDSSTLVPTVTNPDASTLYLVPTSSKSKNMFDEYVWTGTDWEKFGTGSVALPSPTTADNGKVLGVDGGEYKLVEQSGGSEYTPQKYIVVQNGASTYGLLHTAGGPYTEADWSDLCSQLTILDSPSNSSFLWRSYGHEGALAVIFTAVTFNDYNNSWKLVTAVIKKDGTTKRYEKGL